MVSKVAVMALVAVVAVPILLGYGLNFQTDTYNAWEENGTPVDLSTMLTNITDKSRSTYTDADLYLYNAAQYYVNGVLVGPIYKQTTSTYTPIQITQEHLTKTNTTFTVAQSTDPFVYVNVDGGYDASNYISMTVTKTDNTSVTYDHVKTFSWTLEGYSGRVDAAFIEPGDVPDAGYGQGNVSTVSFTVTGTVTYWYQYAGNTYADLSKGYVLNADNPPFTAPTSTYLYTDFWNSTVKQSMVISFNLDSITQSDYWMAIHFSKHDPYSLPTNYSIELIKKTVGGVAQWSYKTYGDNDEHSLFYNTDLSNNTYQLYLNGDTGGEFRYIGAWKDTIGVEPALITYPFEYDSTLYGWQEPGTLPNFKIYGQTPTMRIDYALVAAYQYRVIEDVTFYPLHYLGGVGDNPATTLSNIAEYGSSIVFGGQTYTVTDGKITVDGKSVKLSGIKFDSVTSDGGYDNRINGIVVSTTADPSGITLNGDWVLTVKTVGQEMVFKESTHWVAGKFAWQGVDTNFKMAALFTCLVAFIALGIYARSKGASVIPLLLICGGAAFMFFLMI